jgi:hypothetical protein
VELADVLGLVGLEPPAQQLVRHAVGVAEPLDGNCLEPRQQCVPLAVHARDRGRVARRELIVVAMIAERGRPGRRPPHRVLPVIGDHGRECRIGDTRDGIGREW